MAKSRLSPILSIDERKQFCLEMLKDVLTAVKVAKYIQQTVVTSNDKTALQIAKDFNALSFKENKLGLNQAVSEVINWCIRKGALSTLILLADIPSVTPLDLNRIFTHKENPGIVISPSESGEGTNALLLVPPNVLPTFYGPHSFQKHTEEALTRGINIHILRSSRVALDIDTIEDLVAFLAFKAKKTCSYNFLMKRGIHERLISTRKKFKA
jgi:2-phospho-L-lactate guanylyltransferase